MVKLKGSSLIEALIAMVIISLSFGIGSIIFVNIYKNNSIQNTFRAKRIIEKESFSCKQNKNYIDNEKKVEDYLVVQKIEKMDDEDNLAWLKIIAYKDNKIVAKQIELINFNE